MKSTMREADVLADSSGHRPARDAMAEPTSDLDDNGSETKTKEEKTAKLKKHPGAPKRFRTHGELRAKLQEEGAEIDTINVARMVSDQWREMSQEDKEHWEEMAREDKARYLRQKEEYAGPWKVPADMKKPKDPTAPKKPTPAYFSFSNERRQSVKKDNPTASNGEISKILSKMWKEADEDTRTLYVEKEKAERAVYNKAVEEWKKERKESGRENWWDYDTAGVAPAIDGQSGGDRKRARLDILADAAPHRGEMSTGGNFGGSGVDQVLSGTSMTPLNGGAFGGGGGSSSSFPLSGNLQDQLSALSSQGGLQTIAALLPGLLGGGQQGTNYMGVSSSGALPPLPQVDTSSAGGGLTSNSNPHVLDALQRILGQQQQPSAMGSSGRGGTDQSQLGGGNAAYPTFLGGGSSSSMGVTGFNNMSGGGGGGNQQQNLLAALLAGGSSAAPGYQQELQSFHQDNSFNQGVGNANSVGDILSLLYRQQQPAAPPPPQPPQQQSGLHSLLQGFPGNFFSQLHQSSSTDNHQQNSNSALAAFLGQQQGSSSGGGVFQQASSSSTHPSGGNDQLSQSLLQSLLQQQSGGSNQALSFGSQQPSGPSNNAWEEALQRLIQNQQQQH